MTQRCLASSISQGMASITCRFVLAAALIPAPIAAQSFLHLPATSSPAQTELPAYSLEPFTRANARVQLFYDASEVGATSFFADGLDLRFDGPIPAVGAPGPFQIQRLTLRIGTSTVASPGATFAANLSSPLVTAFDGPVTYWPDQGSQSPAPWGGSNGSLSFAFVRPVPIAIPAGGWLVVEIAVLGNNLNGAAHAMLDADRGPGGPVDGFASSFGTGCATSTSAAPASIRTAGVHAPGVAHSITGQNLGANAPVAAALGASASVGPLGSLPLALPGTSCLIHTSWEGFLFGSADAGGAIAAGNPAFTVAVPPIPWFAGATYHAQLFSVVPGANPPFGLVLSDRRTVQLGSLNPRARGMYMVASTTSATAPFADFAGELVLAVRLRTQ